MLSGAFPPPLLLLMVLLVGLLYAMKVMIKCLMPNSFLGIRKILVVSQLRARREREKIIIVMFSAHRNDAEQAKIGFQIIIVISIYSFCNFQFFFQFFFFSYKCIAGVAAASIATSASSAWVLFSNGIN